MTTRPLKKPASRPTLAPLDFVADAERMTNERDVDSIDRVYARDATTTSTIDGLVISADGVDQIRERWRLMCRFMEARGLTVSKRLVTSDEHTIVNEWSGSMGGRAAARGIEVWEFDEHGLVRDQRLYGFLNTGPDTSLLQSLRMLLGYPLTALTFTRLRLTARKR